MQARISLMAASVVIGLSSVATQGEIRMAARLCRGTGVIVHPVWDEMIRMVFQPPQGFRIEPLITHAAVPLDADGEAVMLGINHNGTGVARRDA